MAVQDVIGNPADLISQAMFWIFMIFVVGGLAVMAAWFAVFLYKYTKYKVKVYIAEPIGEEFKDKEGNVISNHHILWSQDIARESTSKEGKAELSLFKTNLKMGLPSSKMYSTGGIFGARKVLFLRNQQGLLSPMSIVESSPVNFSFDLEGLGNALAWREQSREMRLENYKGKVDHFQKYGTIYAIGTLIIIQMVLMFILISQIQDGVTVRAVIDTSQLISAQAVQAVPAQGVT